MGHERFLSCLVLADNRTATITRIRFATFRRRKEFHSSISGDENGTVRRLLVAAMGVLHSSTLPVSLVVHISICIVISNHYSSMCV